MNFINRFAGVIALIAILLAIGGYFYPQIKTSLGAITSGVTNFNQLGVSELKIGSACNDSFGYSGCTATAITKIQYGTCTLIGADASIAASSSAPFDCAVTGAVSTDGVIAQFSTSSPTHSIGFGGGFVITAAKASSTSGFITVVVENLNTVARVLSLNGIASTTQYWVFK